MENQPEVFINSIVLCKTVESNPKEPSCNFIGAFHSLVLDYSLPNFEITPDFQICINAVVKDAAAVHKIVLAIKYPDGTQKMLGDFTLAIPRYGISATQVPFQLTLNQEGLHSLFFFLKGDDRQPLARYVLSVGSDTILVDASDTEH